MMMMNGRNGRYPFTASQWQELEHQALIFKYMASGHPIPSDLILPIKRSVLLDSTSPTASLFPHQPNIGWGCFQMGFGRKVEDPEPGRCRRTDGKKWRCSKEAHPDSKYCERHMHRGKNRSRKPVETPLSNITTANSSTNNIAGNVNATSSDNNGNHHHHHHHHGSSYASSLYQTHYHHHSMVNPDAAANHAYYPYSSYSRPPGIGLSAQNHPAQFHLDSGCSTSTDRDFRYFHGMREEADQYGCFPEASGPERDGSWRFTPLGMSSLGEPKQRSFLQQDCYSHLSTDLSKEGNENGETHGHLKQQQHCFVLGADFKLQTPVKEDGVAEEESQKPLRRFFDEWPLKSKESWIDLEEDRSNWSSSFSKTQLSISTPISHHDFAIANPHSRNDD